MKQATQTAVLVGLLVFLTWTHPAPALSTSSVPACGDGIVDFTAGEQCDAGGGGERIL